jgi:metacaspase-1
MPKRALLIGINYIGGAAPLNGCINDIMRVKDMLVARGYTDIVCLRDDDAAATPTRARIVAELIALAGKYQPGDQIYVHYSGHGSYVKDTSGDELDGRDECICPVDYPTAGFIIDDDLNAMLLTRVPAGCRIRVVFDSCHSGSALDLPIRWVGGSKTAIENYNTKLDAKGNPVDCVFLSGCQDQQTSADAYINGKYSGALTYAWLQAIADADAAAKTSAYTWKDIGVSCQLWLKKNAYTQIPQLGVCQRTQLTRPFDL